MARLRASTKIVIGFAALSLGSYFGYQVYADRAVMGLKFTELAPGSVNLVGIATDRGYQIRVANQMAQLVEGITTDFSGAGRSGDENAVEGTGKRRIPIKEMLGALRGDLKALGQFVAIINEKQENENWPPERVYWEAADLRKALDGDAELVKKLEYDLNVKLDGTPLPTLRIRSLENGIIVRTPVPIRVRVAGEEKVLEAMVEEPYLPKLMGNVQRRYENKPNASQTDQIGYYLTESQALLKDPKGKENVRASLETFLSEARAKELAVRPEQILASAKVVVNENLIDDASYSSFDAPNGGKLHNLKIHLNDEGRKRLWQYSRTKVGTQLLLIVDGVAIAAPRISHDLAQSELTITQLPDEVLVREAVQGIQNKQNQP